MSVTYLNIDDDIESMTTRAVRAITAGKASVTIGPLVTLEINTDLSSYKIGDRIPRQDQRSEYRLHAAADFSVRKGIWQFPEQTYTLAIEGNSGVLACGTEPILTAERGTPIICSADIESIAVFDKSSG